MNEDPRQKRSLQVVADAKRLIAEADSVLNKGRGLFAKLGLDRHVLQRQLDQLPLASRLQAQQQFEQELRQVVEREREAQRLSAQATSSRPMRKPRNMI